MKLLILTQSVDRHDPNLGAFYRWWEEFARQCRNLTFVALRVGTHSFPSNVKVISAGKEKGKGRTIRRFSFALAALKNLRNVDAIFVHMIPEYVLVVGPLARLLGKKVYLWYAHGATPITLRLALPFVTKVFTSSPAGFRLHSQKVSVVGQAIDTALFTLSAQEKREGRFSIVTTGRISRVKRIDLMFEALAQLPHATLTLVGEKMTEDDKKYYEELNQQAKVLGIEGRVSFIGALSYEEMPRILVGHDIFLNLSQTGSLDKAVLEAMATGLPVLTSNPAFTSMLPEGNLLREATPAEIARKVLELRKGDYPNSSLREKVLQAHSLTMTVNTILRTMEADLL